MEDNNEWISVGDLMAGAVAVVAMMFAITLLQNKFSNLSFDPTERKELTTFLKDFSTEIQGSPGLSVNIEQFKLHLDGEGFNSGRSCLLWGVSNALENLNNKLSEFMLNHRGIIIIIEGHSDTTPINDEVKDDCRCKKPCKSNIELSLARALVARDIITNNWNTSMKERVLVHGYGFHHYDKSKSMSENRRVEISFNFSRVK